MHAPILIVTDFSQAADLATQRAVLLACQHDTELLLAHLRGSGPPDVAERLPRLAALLARRHRLPVRLLGSLDLPGLRQAAAAQAGLLVMGWPPPAARRFPWSAGVFALRLLWCLGCPLLVVRLPAAQAYRRLLVAVGPDPAPATGLLRAAATLAPGAELELFMRSTPGRKPICSLPKPRAARCMPTGAPSTATASATCGASPTCWTRGATG